MAADPVMAGELAQVWAAEAERETVGVTDTLAECEPLDEAATLAVMERDAATLAESVADGETLGEAAALGVWVVEAVTLRDSAEVLALGDGERVAEAATDGETDALAATLGDGATEPLALGEHETLAEAATDCETLAEMERDAVTLAESVADGETLDEAATLAEMELDADAEGETEGETEGVAETEKTWRSATNDTQSQPTLFAPMYTSIVPPAGRLVTVLVKVSGFEAVQPALLSPAAGTGKAYVWLPSAFAVANTWLWKHEFVRQKDAV